MNKNYIILMSMLLVLAAGLLLLPEKNNPKQMNPEELMWDIVQPTRYVTTDDVAKSIIEQDPLLMLVDVRSESDFQDFALSGAINLPLEGFASDDTRAELDYPKKNIVFYSNDDLRADQAWVLAKRLGFNNVYVLRGGLNQWIKTIIQPVEPAQTASAEEFSQYTFRKGASLFFTGTKLSTTATTKESVVVTRKKKSSAVAGGC